MRTEAFFRAGRGGGRFTSHGKASAPVLIFVGSCLASAAAFFLITKPMLNQPQPAPAAATAQPQAIDAAAAAKAEAEKNLAALPEPGTPDMRFPVPVDDPPPLTPAPPTPKSTGQFLKPADLAAEIVAKMKQKDAAALGGYAVGTAESRVVVERAFERLFGTLGAEVPEESAAREIGQAGSRRLFSVPVTAAGSPLDVTLELEVDRASQSWKLAEVVLPFQLRDAVETSGSVAAMGAPVRAGGEVAALSFADSFVRSLQDRDFSAAAAMIDQSRVPPERIAGLCIILEESGFQLAKERPLVETAGTPGQSLVVAKLETPGRDQVEFGMRLTRPDEAAPWVVSDLNLSALLAAYVSETDTSVPYSPIVKNPSGGESIVVYFRYDEAALHERARQQLEVISALLKANPSRHINISGYTDAHGSDQYNLDLSGKRAAAVLAELRRLGVEDSQIRALAKGKENPLNPNTDASGGDNPLGRATNRRAEIFLNF